MHVLVTGATGRIGRNLTAALLDRGDHVRALVMPGDPGLDGARARGIECLSVNLRDAVAVGEAVQGVDAIVHLGAAMLWGDTAYDTLLFDDNVRGTFNLLDAVVRHNPGLHRFVLASSDEVYPSLLAQGVAIQETHPTTPWSFYGLTKLMCEEMAGFYHRAYHVPSTVARFALTIEPREVLHADTWLGKFLFLEPMINILKITAGAEGAAVVEKLRTGDETLLLARDENGEPYVMHHCDVRDLVQGLLLLLEQPAAVGEIFNLGGAGPFRYDEAIPYLSEKLAIPYVEACIPGQPIRIRQSIDKAQSLLGYGPVYDIFRTIDTAVQTGKLDHEW